MPASELIVVTGSAGFIGSHVVRALLTRGSRVLGIDNFDPFYARSRKEQNLALARGGARPGQFENLELDLTDAARLTALLRERAPQGVIHLAAKAGVRPSIADPAGYMHANVTGTASVLSAASAAGVSRVVCASSSSVYGNAEAAPFHEDMDVSRPISPYAASKRGAELVGYAHHALTRLPVAMLRFFTVYGPGQRPDLAIAQFLDKIARGEAISMFGDGRTSRDYTYIDDIVAGVVSAYARIDAHGYRVWNLGSHSPVTLSEMIRAVERTVGKPAQIRPMPAQPGDVERTCADLTRSGAELGYAPGTSLEAGLARQWAWARAHA